MGGLNRGRLWIRQGKGVAQTEGKHHPGFEGEATSRIISSELCVSSDVVF
jgi:hypothetical protein